MKLLQFRGTLEQSELHPERANGKHLGLDGSLVHIHDSTLTWPLSHLSSYNGAFVRGNSNGVATNKKSKKNKHIWIITASSSYRVFRTITAFTPSLWLHLDVPSELQKSSSLKTTMSVREADGTAMSSPAEVLMSERLRGCLKCCFQEQQRCDLGGR